MDEGQRCPIEIDDFPFLCRCGETRHGDLLLSWRPFQARSSPDAGDVPVNVRKGLEAKGAHDRGGKHLFDPRTVLETEVGALRPKVAVGDGGVALCGEMGGEAKVAKGVETDAREIGTTEARSTVVLETRQDVPLQVDVFRQEPRRRVSGDEPHLSHFWN